MDRPDAPILLVDDNAKILDTTARYLRARGFNIVTSDSPIGVSSLIRLCRPALIVLDVMMPALDGAALAHVFTSNGLATDIPIVFYSAVEEEQLYAVARKFPNATYVSKVDGLTTLLVVVESRIGSRSPVKSCQQ